MNAGHRWRIMRPIDRSGIGPCLIEGEEFFGATLFVRFPEGCLLFLHLAQIDFASFGIHEVSNHGDSSGGVKYMQDRVTVMGGDLDCRMSLAGRRSADQQGRSMPRRSISLATCTISSSEGVMRPLKPTMSAPNSTAFCKI